MFDNIIEQIAKIIITLGGTFFIIIITLGIIATIGEIIKYIIGAYQ